MDSVFWLLPQWPGAFAGGAGLKAEYSIVLVTHNMQQAARVADLTAFFGVDISHGGRTGYLVEMEETTQIFTAPREQLTKEYVRGEFS
jgi:phosphate transport system ATP-binding protein